MKIVAHNRLSDPIEMEVTRVVIFDDYDQPIALALSQGKGMVMLATGQSSKDRAALEATLRSFGIRHTRVAVEQVPTEHPTFE